MGVFHPENLFEKPRAQLQIDPVSGAVDKIGAQRFEPELEAVGDQRPDREHEKRLLGVVRNDAIVDIHHEQRSGQGEQVEKHGREGDSAIERAVGPQGAPEPGSRFGVFRRSPHPGAVLNLVGGFCQDDESG